MMTEELIIFNSRGKQLVGVMHHAMSAKKGMIIVVGGPQTRVGSHRLFVILARKLAAQGVTVFRFDYTGSGDSEGGITEFTHIQADISVAIDTFRQLQPQVTELTLWGLCDAASAILLYLANSKNIIIDQIVLVNPWVRQTSTVAKAYLTQYYFKRFFRKAFWQKLLKGKVKIVGAMSDIHNFHRLSKQNSNQDQQIPEQQNFVGGMLQGLSYFNGITNIILSGNDLTADEFRVLQKKNQPWGKILKAKRVNISTIEQANHTFSCSDTKKQLIDLTILFMDSK